MISFLTAIHVHPLNKTNKETNKALEMVMSVPCVSYNSFQSLVLSDILCLFFLRNREMIDKKIFRKRTFKIHI